jgi:SM-20-related protein
MHVYEQSLNGEINYLKVANDLYSNGYSVIDHAFAADIENTLLHYVLHLDSEQYQEAAIGRADQQTINPFVRSDEIRWIDHHHATESLWLNQMEKIRCEMNRLLFLELFSYESHFACYQPGAFYKKHVDAFKGQANRLLSTVYYLNPNWQPEEGGELVMYDPEQPALPLFNLSPTLGTLIIFLSEEFPHEVLPALRKRHNIAGWFRLNNSIGDQIDPPR